MRWCIVPRSRSLFKITILDNFLRVPQDDMLGSGLLDQILCIPHNFCVLLKSIGQGCYRFLNVLLFLDIHAVLHAAICFWKLYILSFIRTSYYFTDPTKVAKIEEITGKLLACRKLLACWHVETLGLKSWVSFVWVISLLTSSRQVVNSNIYDKDHIENHSDTIQC